MNNSAQELIITAKPALQGGWVKTPSLPETNPSDKAQPPSREARQTLQRKRRAAAEQPELPFKGEVVSLLLLLPEQVDPHSHCLCVLKANMFSVFWVRKMISPQLAR